MCLQKLLKVVGGWLGCWVKVGSWAVGWVVGWLTEAGSLGEAGCFDGWVGG